MYCDLGVAPVYRHKCFLGLLSSLHVQKLGPLFLLSSSGPLWPRLGAWPILLIKKSSYAKNFLNAP